MESSLSGKGTFLLACVCFLFLFFSSTLTVFHHFLAKFVAVEDRLILHNLNEK